MDKNNSSARKNKNNKQKALEIQPTLPMLEFSIMHLQKISKTLAAKAVKKDKSAGRLMQI